MPIRGLTDKSEFPQIGDIRKGAPKTTNRPGEDLEHFRFESDEAEVEELFRDAFGPNPKRIRVRLPYPTTEENFDAYLEEYVASGLQRRCDGETICLWRDDKGEVHTSEKPCESGRCQCKETGRLKVVIPELKRMGLVVVHTTSKHDIMNLHGALSRYEQVAKTSGGNLSGIPFILRRRKQKISTPSGKGGGRARREKSLLCIEPESVWVSVQLEAARQRSLDTSRRADTPQIGGKPRLIGDGSSNGQEIVVEDAEVTRQELTGPDPTPLKEAQTAASDFGFGKDDRAVRLAFCGLIVGQDLTSFKDLSSDDANRVTNGLEYMMSSIPGPLRRPFANWAVQIMPSLETAGQVDRAFDDFEQSRAAVEEGR